MKAGHPTQTIFKNLRYAITKTANLQSRYYVFKQSDQRRQSSHHKTLSGFYRDQGTIRENTENPVGTQN